MMRRRLDRRVAEAASLALLGGVIAWKAVPGRLRPIGVLSAAVNGAISGRRGTYDWTRHEGPAAFVLDSSWAILGTTSGVLLECVQLAFDARYRGDLSHRRNRHIYERGVRGHPDFAITMGQVVTNAGGRRGLDTRRLRLVDRHEELHIWQQRALGPLYPAVYGIWVVGGATFGFLHWLRHRDDLIRDVVTTAYYDNPLEYWAYRRDAHWPPQRANPALVWPGLR